MNRVKDFVRIKELEMVKDKKNLLKKLSLLVFCMVIVTLWNNEIITANVPGINISVKGDYVPNISAQLISPAQNTAADPSKEIEVTYKINPEQFEYNANLNSGPIGEAVFVVDETKKMNDGERYKNFRNGFNNSILDGTILGDRDIKFNVVGYNDSVNFPNNDNYNVLIGRKSEREKLRLAFQDYISISNTSTNRNIEDALDRANNLLQEKGEQGKNKAIILVTSGDANYDSNSSIIKTISQKGYKIISLDLSNVDGSENSNLKTLHQLLAGKDDDYILAKADGGNYNTPEINYSESIAKKLLGGTQTNTNTNTIVIKGAKLNFDLGENFDAATNSGLDGTGKIRSVNIPDIIYTKDENSGKYVCQQEAQSLQVKFKIIPTEGKKGKVGFAEDSETDSDQNLKNYISYNRLDGIEVKKHIETPILNIGAPNINAYLRSPEPNTLVNQSQPIAVQYEIKTDDFEYNFGNSPDGAIDEAVFVVDITNDQGNGQDKGNDKRWQLMNQWFDAILLDDNYTGLNNLQGRNMKFGIIGYGYDDRLFDRNVDDDKNALSSIVEGQPQWNSDIGQSLKKADDLLQTKGDKTANKAIVLIESNDNFSYSKEEIYEIKSKGYKIITLNMDWAPGQVKKSALPELHQALGGVYYGDDNTYDDYAISDRYKPNNDNAKEDMIWIAGKLKAGITHRSISGNNIKLNFDLGENFKQDTGLQGEGKICVLPIQEPIEYTLQYNSEKGKYLWHQTSSIVKTFTVKVDGDKDGQLGFGFYKNSDIKCSTISYNDFSNTLINKEIDTPVIEVNKNIAVDVNHGVYKGIEDGIPNIDKAGGAFAKGSIVPMAASFNFHGNAEIQLTLGDNGLPGGEIMADGNIKIYKVATNGSLTPIGIMNGSGSSYSASIREGLSIGDKVLIMYNAKLPSVEGTYTNNIRVGNSGEIPAKLTVGGELRDLF